MVLASRDINLQRRLLDESFRSWKYFLRYTVTGKLSVECFHMSELGESKRTELEKRLSEVDQRLRSEMVARGFDPAQDNNVALTAPLAKLYMERENLRAELEALTDREINGLNEN